MITLLFYQDLLFWLNTWFIANDWNLTLHISAIFVNHCLVTRTTPVRIYENKKNWLIHQYQILFHDDLKRINKSKKENKWIILISNKTLKQKNKFCLKDHMTNPSWHHQTKTRNAWQHQTYPRRRREVFNITILLYCVSLHTMMWYIINFMYVCKGIRPLEMAKWRQNLLARPHAEKNWNLWKSIIQYSSDWTTYTHQYKQINEISTKHVCLWIRVIRFQFLCHLE